MRKPRRGDGTSTRPAFYYHFKDKAAILRAIGRAAIAEIDVPPEGDFDNPGGTGLYGSATKLSERAARAPVSEDSGRQR